VGFYTEIVAYLATRENGSTLAQFETAFNLAPARARSDIRIARNWLGSTHASVANTCPMP